MNPHDIHHLAPDTEGKWDADNSDFVLGDLLPFLQLSDADKQVIEWCYTPWPWLDGLTYEQDSDGETLVHDTFLNGTIKSPAGVSHDGINRWPEHTTPDGHKWTAMQANKMYLRISKSLGYGISRRWRRFLGVTVSIPFWWK